MQFNQHQVSKETTKSGELNPAKPYKYGFAVLYFGYPKYDSSLWIYTGVENVGKGARIEYMKQFGLVARGAEMIALVDHDGKKAGHKGIQISSLA